MYACTPCGEACDNESYAEGGFCRLCKMELVKQSTINFKNIKPEEVCAFVKANKKVLLLDVRSADEFDGRVQPDYGTLKNAMNIPVTELADKVDKLKKWKGKDIIVYCSLGKRSATASYRLGLLGFEKVHNMTGGLSQLKDESCKKKR